MPNNNTDFEYKYVNTKEILVDSLYQRDLDQRKVNGIVKRFDWNLVNAPKVSFRDGKYWVFDGQHTIAACKSKRGGKDFPIMCKVFYGLARLDEMNLFLQQNGKSSPVSVYAKFRALYQFGDPDITAIAKACENTGLKMEFSGGSRGSNKIVALRTLYRSYKELGPVGLTDTLSIIKEAWNGIPESLNREIISAVTIFYKTYQGSFNRKRLVKILHKTDPVAIVREGKSITTRSEIGCARVILRTYNRQLSEATRLEEKL